MARQGLFLLLMAALALPCGAAEWQDAFDYPDGSGGEPAWAAASAAWMASDGRMTFDGGSKTFLVLEKLPHGREVSVEATLTVDARKGTGWAVAGVAVRRDDANHWHVALVESPEEQGHRRTVELAEGYEGRWPANWQGETRLRATADEGAGFTWEYGRPYRLAIRLTPEGIEGTVRELDGTLRRRLAFAFDDRPAVRTGRPALDAATYRAWFDDVRAAVNGPVTPPREPAPAAYPPYDVTACEEVSGRATGFFHLEQVDGAWWLIDPMGRGFYAVGIDHAKYRGHWCQALGYAPYGRNVERKYGGERAWAEATSERLRAWGFNTLAAGHSPSLRYRGLAHIELLGAGRSFADIDDIVPRTTWTGFPNVFSPRWERHCEVLARRICAPNRDDPWLIGYFLDNELQWFGDLSNWRNELGLFTETWRKPPGHTAKQAWLGGVRQHCPTVADFNAAWGTQFASFEALAASAEPRPVATEAARAMARDYVRLVSERYFGTLADAIRRHDPNHLVLGCRFAGWSPGLWDLAGSHCDVVSFNKYPRIDVDRGVPAGLVEEFRGIHREAGGPLMITEWSFPALDSGLPNRHGAGMRVATQQQKARCYRAFQSTMFALPFMVGSHYFMYVDEPELGISDTFPEDSNYGLVRESDEPWPELTRMAAEVNPRACELHRSGRLEWVHEGGEGRAWLRQPPEKAVQRAGPLVLRSGPLELTEATSEGLAWSMRLDGRTLGAFFPLIHQKTPADAWRSPDAAALEAVRRDDDFTVVEMAFAHTPGADERTRSPDYAAGWRFWVPAESSGWFASQPLWVENTSDRPWTLAGLFHYTRPAIGASQDGDGEAPVNVPNFYLPVAGWEDAEARLGQGCTTLDGEVRLTYWRDEDGFHSDCRQPVNVRLGPGERWEGPGAVAIIFGYRLDGPHAILQAVGVVRKEALALQPGRRVAPDPAFPD